MERRGPSMETQQKSSTLTLSLFSSLAICFAFLPNLPIDLASGSSKSQSLYTYMISRICIAVLILIVAIQLIRYIRSTDKFHQGQVVFWPMRCRHCARILGALLSASDVEQFDINIGSDGSRSSSCPCTDTCNNDSTQPNESTPLLRNALTAESSLPSCSSCSATSSSNAAVANEDLTGFDDVATFSTSHADHSVQLRVCQHCRSHVTLSRVHIYFRRHRSLANVFVAFAILAIFTVPVLLIGKIICGVENGEGRIVFVSAEVEDLSLLFVLPVGIIFTLRYYDAVLVSNTQNAFSIVMFMTAAIWISTWELVNPINTMLDDIENDCILNGTFGHYVRGLNRAMSAFYTECGIAATGILWMMWKSFVPKSVVNIYQEMPRYEAFRGTKYTTPSSALLPLLFKRIRLSRRGSNNSRFDGILENNPVSRIVSFSIRIWCTSFLFSFLYFSLCMFVIYSSILKTDQRIYVLWSLEIPFFMPVFMLLFHIFGKNLSNLEEEGTFHASSLEGHEILLLFCTCGLFMQSFIRLIAASGLLISGHYVSPDKTALFIFAIIYSVEIIAMVGCTTLFLLRVQRQRVIHSLDIKWVLSSLIYITVANSTEWFRDSLYVEVWSVQALYFGPTTGRVIGILLDPFATLYGLHAAMVAYEEYKTILKGEIQRERKVNGQM